MIDISRNTTISLDPDGVILGPKVLLADEFSASDGDLVTYRFKKYNLGPVIGKADVGRSCRDTGISPLPRRRLHEPAGIFAV